MNKTATPGTCQAAKGLPAPSPLEATLEKILDSAERSTRLLEALMDLVKDPGPRKMLEVVRLDAAHSADEAARCLGVRTRW